MNCIAARKNSSAFLSEELSGNSMAAMRSHLRSCASCQQAVAEEQELVQALRAEPALDVPDAMWGGILAAVEEDEGSAAARNLGQRLWSFIGLRPAVASLALAGCVLLAVFAAKGAGTFDSAAQAPKARVSASPALTVDEAYEAQRQRGLHETQEALAQMRELAQQELSQWPSAPAQDAREEMAAFLREAVHQGRFAIASQENEEAPEWADEMGFLHGVVASVEQRP